MTVRIVSTILSIYVTALLGSPAVALEIKLTGQVVEYRGQQPLSKVAVELRHAQRGKVVDTKTTDSNGMYEFKVDGGVPLVYLSYKADQHDPEARSAVETNCNPKTLDTVGLVNRKDTSAEAQGAAARGVTRFASVTGDTDTASAAVAARTAKDRYWLDRLSPEILVQMERAGVRYR